MKHILLIIALISTLSAFEWPGDYYEALSQAKKEKKDIYVLIGAEDCPWCTKFKDRTLSDKELIKVLKKDYILLYLAREIDDIPSHLKPTPLPRHYFLTSRGEIIHTIIGYRDTESFYETLDDVKEYKKD